MYGWRARLGLVLPMDNAVIEPEIASLGLAGIAAYAVRLGTIDRARMPRSGVELSAAFNELGVDAVGYACAETSFLGGVDTNVTVRDGIESVTGRPAVTAIGAMTEALESLGAGTVAVAAPYRRSSADALEAYLDHAGFRIANLVTKDFSESVDDEREWYATNVQPPSTAYAMARSADRPEADVVVVAATNLRSFEAIAPLESDLRKPVISTNSALLWALLGRCGVWEPRASLGRLWSGSVTISKGAT